MRSLARAVHGWAEDNGYTVLFCTGNLGLREMYEAVRDEADARVLLVDRSRSEAKIPLFYPDLEAAAGPRRQFALSLREYLVETTGDTRWPHLVDDRNLSRLILDHLPGVLAAHTQLRQLGGDRFSDTDLHRIVLGAALGVNPFKPLAPPEIRRVCVEQHQAIDELKRLLPESVLAALRTAIAAAPKPFCYLWDRDAGQVIRAFTLAAIMHQHGLEYQVLLGNLDPSFREYREIEPAFLAQAMQDQLHADPERVAADVADVEAFLRAEPAGRLAFLAHERLGLDGRERALAVLKAEKLSPLVCSLALLSLLLDLIETKQVKFHAQVLKALDAQAQNPELPALRRPSESWQALEIAYRRAYTLYGLTGKLLVHLNKLQVTAATELDFAYFDRLWNEDRINRLDFYASDLTRMLRVGDILPIPHKDFWPELAARWDAARAQLDGTLDAVEKTMRLTNKRFQDLYALHYAGWIRKPHSPVVFTHQFLACFRHRTDERTDVLTKGTSCLRIWVLQVQAGKPMPKTQRFRGVDLARHGHRVPGTAKPGKIDTQLGHKWVRTSRITGAPMALSVEPRMLCISIRMGLLPARACLPSFVLRPPSNDHLRCVGRGGHFVLLPTPF